MTKTEQVIKRLKQGPMLYNEAYKILGESQLSRLVSQGFIERYLDENPGYAEGRHGHKPMCYWLRLGEKGNTWKPGRKVDESNPSNWLKLRMERDRYKAALDEWLDKTAWVQQEISAGKLPAHYLGQHRADIMSAEIERLRGEVERYKSQVVEEAGKVLNLAGENARLRASIPQPDWKLCTACREMHPRDRFDKAHPDFPTRDGLNLICREAADKRGYRLHRRPDGKVEEVKE